VRPLSTPSGLWDDSERLDVEELRALQLDRLRTTLSHAYTNVAHYTAAFDAIGLHPSDLVGLQRYDGSADRQLG
jgi:phenylacetate-CoA ligase